MVPFVDEQTRCDLIFALESRAQRTIVIGFRRARVTVQIGRITRGAR